MGAKLAENGAFYIYTFFLLTFADKIKLERTTVLIAISLAALLMVVTIPAFGRLSDRAGRRIIYLSGAVFTGLFVFPFFQLVETKQPGWVMLAVVPALALGWASMYAPQASFFSELFDTRVRYSGASLGAQAATIFAGGLLPVIAPRLLGQADSYQMGNYWPVALIIVAMSAVTTASVLLAAETAQKDITPKPEARLQIVQSHSGTEVGDGEPWGTPTRERMHVG
jgi:MFS transporter, MHS family, shikimate and dehydroshikimate transport protein